MSNKSRKNISTVEFLSQSKATAKATKAVDSNNHVTPAQRVRSYADGQINNGHLAQARTSKMMSGLVNAAGVLPVSPEYVGNLIDTHGFIDEFLDLYERMVQLVTEELGMVVTSEDEASAEALAIAQQVKALNEEIQEAIKAGDQAKVDVLMKQFLKIGA